MVYLFNRLLTKPRYKFKNLTKRRMRNTGKQKTISINFSVLKYEQI